MKKLREVTLLEVSSWGKWFKQDTLLKRWRWGTYAINIMWSLQRRTFPPRLDRFQGSLVFYMGLERSLGLTDEIGIRSKKWRRAGGGMVRRSRRSRPRSFFDESELRQSSEVVLAANNEHHREWVRLARSCFHERSLFTSRITKMMKPCIHHLSMCYPWKIFEEILKRLAVRGWESMLWSVGHLNLLEVIECSLLEVPLCSF